MTFPKVIEWMPESNRPDGELLTSYVSGDMPTNQRNQSLQALGQISDNQRYVLGNARCLSEGVDVPTLDGIAFIDPRNSEIDIVQAVGRAIRLADGKDKGTIVIPVFIPDYEDPDEVLSGSPFKKIWAVINALRSHDDALAIELDGFRKQLGKRGTVGRSAKIHFDLPTTVSADFERALDTKLIESTTASWEFWFGLLDVYKDEHGDCLVSGKHITDSGHKLGNWVSNQRRMKEQLTPERIQRLDALGFVWDQLAEQWEQGFRELLTYKEEHGDCLVSGKHITASGHKLGNWVSNQRSKKEQLTPELIQRLFTLGFVWDPLAEQWEQGIRELLTYKEEHGDCLVSGKYITASGHKLGVWVSTQRRMKEQLTPERIQRLDALGFVWDPLAEQWEQGIRELLTYKEEHGDCLVSGKYITASGHKLGNWVSARRSKKDKLTPEQVQRLDALGFVWDAIKEQWKQGIRELRAYKEEHGDSLVKRGYITASGYKLGNWLKVQRSEKDQLTREQVQHLDALGFILDPLAGQWEKGIKELSTYKEKHGDCLVPQRFITASGHKLGSWVGNRRTNKDQLTPEQVQRLDALGFVWKVK